MSRLVKQIVFAILLLIPGGTVAFAAECDRGAKTKTDAILETLGDKKYLLIGEGHGRQEMQPIMEEVFCKLAKQKKTVLYAWELPEDLEGEFISFVYNKEGSNLATLMASPIWQLPSDGTTSKAKLDLIQYIRALNKDDQRIYIKGVATPKNYSIFHRDFYPNYNKIMFFNLMSWGESLPFDHVVFQAGSAHTMLNAREIAGRYQTTVGSLLPPDNTVSIRVDAFKGTSWSLRKLANGSRSFGVHPIINDHLKDVPKNILIPQAPGSDYHGVIVLDEVTASEPAISQFARSAAGAK